MSRRRGTSGFSLAEMLLVTALTTIIVGTVVSLYSFTMTRAARSVSKFSVVDQANRAADIMAVTVQNAVSCTAVGGANTGLRCLMPEVGTDTTGDGYLDQFQPKGVSRRGIEKFGANGKRVWFYRSSNGDYVAPGMILRRAERSDVSQPVMANTDTGFTFYSGSQENFPLVTNATWSVDAAKHEVTITVTGSAFAYREKASPGAPSAETETFVAKRTVKWRNWRR